MFYWKYGVLYTLILLIPVSIVWGELEPKETILVLEQWIPEQGTSIEIINFSIQEYVDKIPIHRLNGSRLVYQELKQSLEIENLDLTILESNNITAEISSNKANFNIQNNKAVLQYQVRYRIKNNIELICDLLEWEMEKDRLFVPGQFKIRQNNRILTGTRLLTDRYLNTGTIEDIEVIVR